MFFFIFLFAVVRISKGQPIDFDLFHYHYYDGFAFWQHRFGQDWVPAGIQTYFNPLLDALNYALYQHFSTRTVACILGGLCGLNAYFLYKICALIFAESVHRGYKIILALVIGLTGATALGQIGNPMNDSQSIIPVMLGLFLLMRQGVFARSAGAFFLGMGMALKLTNGPYFLAALIAFVLAETQQKNWVWALRFVCFGLLGFLVFDGYFAYQLYHTFGDPIFPYFNNVFHSPYYGLETVKDSRFGVQAWYQVFTFPFLLMKKSDLFSELHCRDWRLGLFFILLLLNVLKWKSLNRHFAFFTLFLVIAYVLWAVQFGIYRYAIPLQLVSGPLMVGLVYHFFKNKKWAAGWSFVLTVLAVTTTIHPYFYYQKQFDQHYVTLNAGPLPHHALILITPPESAQSFVIPFFPADDRFIGINFSSQINQRMLFPLIRQSALPLYALFNPGDLIPPAPSLYPVEALTMLQSLGLSPDWGHCQRLNPSVDIFFIKNISLCPLVRHDVEK